MKKLKGFTLIELLVVIAIIGILVAAGTVSYQRSVRLSRDSRRKSDLEQIRQALETYRSEVGEYPATLSLLETNYINDIPEDPKKTDGYQYLYQPGTSPITTYTLCALLESTTGDTNACSTEVCDGTNTCNYQVINP